jgi:glutaredoxin
MRSIPILFTAAIVIALMPRGDATAAAKVGSQPSGSHAKAPRLPSSNVSHVTMYNATWCSACRALERGLKERDIPFDSIDVDRNPQAFQRARDATRTNAIPQTAVARDASEPIWIVGADVEAVERAYRGR